MAKKVVDLTIRLKDGVTGTLNRIKRGFASVGTAVQKLAKVGAVAFGVIGAGAVAMGAAVKKAFDFETAKVQLKTLLGSMDAAKKRFKELQDFSASTPFQLPDLLKASRLLETFTEGALGSAESLRSIGDAAAGVGENIQDVSFWVGRAYSMLKGGKPFGEAAMRLQEMGILTAGGRSELEALQASGEDFTVVWARLQKELKRFEGGMKDLSQTGNGLLSTLKDNWTIAVATFGEVFMDAAKGGIQTMIDTIKRLIEDGSIKRWAEQAKEALDSVVAVTKLLAKGGEGRQKTLAAIADVFKAALIDAAEIAVKILKVAGPALGRVIADGFKAAMLTNQKGLDEDEAIRRIEMEGAQGGFERSGLWGKARDRNNKRIEDEMAKIAAEREGEMMEDIGSAVTSGSRTASALKALKAIADENKPVYVPPEADKADKEEDAKEIAKETGKAVEKAFESVLDRDRRLRALRAERDKKLTGSIYEDDEDDEIQYKDENDRFKFPQRSGAYNPNAPRNQLPFEGAPEKYNMLFNGNTLDPLGNADLGAPEEQEPIMLVTQLLEKIEKNTQGGLM